MWFASVHEARAEARMCLLDRAYSGFEYARDLERVGYDAIMKMSYELQVKPFIEAGAPFLMALSPTKAFLTFSLRPCGFLLLYHPDSKKDAEMTNILNGAMRARGSSFEHAMTRAFARAMVKDRARLEGEHQGALQRLASVERQWRKLVQGTPIDYLFSNSYAGLFCPKSTGRTRGAGKHLQRALVSGVLRGTLPSQCDRAAVRSRTGRKARRGVREVLSLAPRSRRRVVITPPTGGGAGAGHPRVDDACIRGREAPHYLTITSTDAPPPHERTSRNPPKRLKASAARRPSAPIRPLKPPKPLPCRGISSGSRSRGSSLVRGPWEVRPPGAGR